MQKRQSPPDRFAAIDNEAIDALDSILDIGLLTILVRQPPGADVTIDKLRRTHKEGTQALEKSMRRLVQAGYVVKLKIQSSQTFHWRTEFCVSTEVFDKRYIQDMIDSLENVRSLRIEPDWLDPRS